MTGAAVEQIGRQQAAAVAEKIGQATAVEQARAVAEVQAAVIVAQQVPRDMERALAEMRDACGRMSLAEKAFYAVPNRGRGASIHLASELIRIWGNCEFGVRELRRDDARGESEVLAWAWDVQANTRSSRSFIQPHQRMKSGKREPLVDLNDIYLSNQNTGARAVRECIFKVLPLWYVDEATALCRRTLEQGEGKPLEERRALAAAGFESIGIGLDRLEAKVGRKRGQWTAADVADLAVAYQSITRDGIDPEEVLPLRRVTAAEIKGQPVGPTEAHLFDFDEQTGMCSCGLPEDATEHQAP